MFYTPELLSFKRNGKFVCCWLAATLSKEMFKRTFTSATISRHNVEKLCDAIIEGIIPFGTTVRLSLYLSSQLMYGVSKLLEYQTNLLAESVFEFNKKKVQHTMTVGSHDDFVYEFPEIPSPTLSLQDRNLPADLHLMEEDLYEVQVQKTMKDADCLNFGMMTMEEVDFALFGHDPYPERTLMFESIEQQRDDTMKLPNLSFGSMFPEDAVEVREEGVEQTQLIPIVEDSLHILPGTPRKRSLKPFAETPSKKTKFAAKHTPADEIVDAAELEVVPAVEFATALESISQSQAGIQTLTEQFSVLDVTNIPTSVKQKQKMKLLIDAKTIISSSVMRKRIQNVTVSVEAAQQLPIKLVPQYDLLLVPSTMFSGKSWSKTLLKNFNKNIQAPFAVETESSVLHDFEVEEVMLPHGTSALRNNTLVKSTILMDGLSEIEQHTAELIDPSKIAETILPEISKSFITESESKRLENLPIIPEVTTDLEGIFPVAGQELEQFVEDENRQSLPKSSSSSSRTQLTKRELLALLEVHWEQKKHVPFNELLPLTHYDRYDAGLAFSYLLEFVKEEVIVLKQRHPTEWVLIEKCLSYSSNSEVQ